jgi:hypothetical protein
MKKKMLVWIGVAALSVVAVACSKKKDSGTTPMDKTADPAAAPAGGDAYGGAKYGAPAPEAAPAPESK